LNILNLSSLKVRIKMSSKNGIDLFISQFTTTFDDTLADPSIFIGYQTSSWIDLENNTDSETILTRGQRANLRSDLGRKHSTRSVH